jgi:hypothetical protein
MGGVDVEHQLADDSIPKDTEIEEVHHDQQQDDVESEEDLARIEKVYR